MFPGCTTVDSGILRACWLEGLEVTAAEAGCKGSIAGVPEESRGCVCGSMAAVEGGAVAVWVEFPKFAFGGGWIEHGRVVGDRVKDSLIVVATVGTVSEMGGVGGRGKRSVPVAPTDCLGIGRKGLIASCLPGAWPHFTHFRLPSSAV